MKGLEGCGWARGNPGGLLCQEEPVEHHADEEFN